MKKLVILFVSFVLLIQGSFVFAAESTTGGTKVVVTEKIPGMTCSGADNQPLETRKYECTIKPGFGSVMDLLSWLIKYITLIAILVSVLMLVVSGIRMSIEGKKDDAKKLFTRVIISLIVLFMMGFILNTIAPWIFI
ncbi:MAG: hypothetical protein PHZ26_05115 [Candidatus Gracilibacteria bacterium]|nr:hypothetical protein [Candidatus Gracilibacteria bacterium]MDD2909098.1 hypothetical protein [Candidatus Gracilibacteria bacterium]